MLGHKIINIVQSHPASPPNHLTPGASDAVHKTENWLGDIVWQYTGPFLCRVPILIEGDDATSNTYLNIINFFTYGIEHPGDIHYGNKGQYYPPGKPSQAKPTSFSSKFQVHTDTGLYLFFWLHSIGAYM
jgi:hypothetical protein